MRKLLILFSLLGLADASYLTYYHYAHFYLPCGTTIGQCDLVLGSSYAVLFGLPLALYGVFFYLSVLGILLTKVKARFLVVVSLAGLLASFYFVYLQLFVIGAICYYCMGSAITSTLIFLLVQKQYVNERVWFWSALTGIIYTKLLKPLLFQIDPETVHESALALGESLGKSKIAKNIFAFLYKGKVKQIKILGITFKGKAGMAAGFDYTASLPEIVPSLGFGFTTIGSITNSPYSGNPRPRLGRLPKSRSLMVNKGFKNPGVKAIIAKLQSKKFDIPVGISIGRTNVLMSQNESVADIVSAFRAFEKSKVNNAFYELNISCPNLFGNVDFYTQAKLKRLLDALTKLKIKKPVFVKMPISLTNKQTLAILDTISKSFVKGLIIGNLQKDRKNKALDRQEVKKFAVGNFSGKPTFERSNELIKLARITYKDRFVIIGCGGVFNSKDAQAKIAAGADLVQLITGLIYEGPQVISQINHNF